MVHLIVWWLGVGLMVTGALVWAAVLIWCGLAVFQFFSDRTSYPEHRP
jgi:hypothetical protein